MPDLIYCPQCERKLRVPDELRGRSVKFPTCGIIFTAPSETAEPISELPSDAEEPSPPAYEHDTTRESPSRRGKRFELRPHRGTLILVLGILSIVTCGFLGPIAWIMGSND